MGSLKAILGWYFVVLTIAAVCSAPRKDMPKVSNLTVPEEVPYITNQSFMTESDDNVIIEAPIYDRVKRNTPFVGIPWSKRSLTYIIKSFPPGRSPKTVQRAMRLAFSIWSDVTKLSFTEIKTGHGDITIEFGSEIHKKENNQTCKFLEQDFAHAASPGGGYTFIHFNIKYFFSKKDQSMTKFLQVALHEIGHTLGLDHWNDERSIMENVDRFEAKLPPIDIEHIRQLYGVRDKTTVPKLCSLLKIDAVFNDNLGNSFFFAGDYFFDARTPNSTGQLISTRWPGLPGTIGAAFWFAGRTFFFKDDQFWVFPGSSPVRRRALKISSGFPGLPNDLDAALVSVNDDDDNIYAFKGDQYWRYSVWERRVIKNGKLQDIGLPTHFDAVQKTTDGVQIFKGRDVYKLGRGAAAQDDPETWVTC